MVLDQLQPAGVFRFFEEICGIPHGSKDTKKISDYCAAFAKERNLKYIQDESNNIIIFKEGSAGYENSDPVIIQGHLDMVCEKEEDCDIDFATEGLRLELKDGYISAKGTTLGGDDGIAVAYALAILDSDDLAHPPLEVVLTVDEEIGMLGAVALDASPLKGRMMLNVDSEDEGILLVSCAGGMDARCELPIRREDGDGIKAEISLTNLSGGHSGVEINKERANANVQLGRVLYEVAKDVDYALVGINGGLKDNAIPRSSVAEISLKEENVEKLQSAVEKWNDILQKEYRISDPNLTLKLDVNKGEKAGRPMTRESQKNTLAALMNLPNGVQKMSLDIKGLVQTSLNLGILQTTEETVTFRYAVRSSVQTEKEALAAKLESMMAVLGGTCTLGGDYPAWEYKEDSKLREVMKETFTKQYGYEPKIEAIHAGVECGLFCGKLPGLDCISFGPDMDDIHTTGEKLSVESTVRTWNYMIEVLKQLK